MPERATDGKPSRHRVPEGKGEVSTLLPMLVGGLVLIMVGIVIVMNFV